MEQEKTQNALTPSKPQVSKPKLAVVLASIAIIAILIFQNRAHVDTKILFATVTMPHAVLLAVTTGIGFLAGFLMARFRKHR